MTTLRSIRSAASAALSLLVFVTLQVASAQVDERALALLEGLQPPPGEVIDTLDQVQLMTVYQAGAGQEIRTRTVIDYVGRRAAITNEVAPGMVATMTLVDGQVRMVMAGMTIPLPPDSAEAFASIFDRDTADLLADGATASYDGPQAYGELAAGEQVTVRGGAGMVAGVEQADESRYLFDGDGRLVAVVVVTDEGLVIMVFDEPVTANPFVGRGATMYVMGPEGPERFATIAYEAIRINEPIDESLFD